MRRALPDSFAREGFESPLWNYPHSHFSEAAIAET